MTKSNNRAETFFMEVTTKLRKKFAVTMLALTFMLASAGFAQGMISKSNLNAGSSGAIRVDEDLYPFHYDDVNQFGNDEAYNSITGHNHGKVPFPIHREE